MSKWKPPPPVLLELPCIGFLSIPPQECVNTISVALPLDLERMRARLDREGWVVTLVTPPGESPAKVTALCGTCAEALMPELLHAAREKMQKNKS